MHSRLIFIVQHQNQPFKIQSSIDSAIDNMRAYLCIKSQSIFYGI